MIYTQKRFQTEIFSIIIVIDPDNKYFFKIITRVSKS